MNRRHLRGALSATRILAAIAAVSVTAMASAHGTALAGTQGTVKGPWVPLGQGTAQAWVSLGEDGKPEALGVSMSESALAGIEALPGAALTLPFPAEVTGTGFDHVLLNWNPHGHPPGDIYRIPHFDVHFFMISPAAREAISEEDPEFMAKTMRNPEARFVPDDHVPPPEPEPIPGMGVHWVDATAPELHGKPFTHTLLYVDWDGRFIFIESMVVKVIFDEQKTVVAPVKQPAEVAVPGRYPARYRIGFDPAAAEHQIVLEGLVARDRVKPRFGPHAGSARTR